MRAVLQVEFQNFVMLANGCWPVIDMVFIKHNDRIALIARYASVNYYPHTYYSMVCI